MTNKQSWGDNWEEEFDEAFPREMREVYKQGDGSYSGGVVKMNTIIKTFISKLLNSKAEQMEREKKTEEHKGVHHHPVFNQRECLDFNAGISKCIEILKK